MPIDRSPLASLQITGLGAGAGNNSSGGLAGGAPQFRISILTILHAFWLYCSILVSTVLTLQSTLLLNCTVDAIVLPRPPSSARPLAFSSPDTN